MHYRKHKSKPLSNHCSEPLIITVTEVELIEWELQDANVEIQPLQYQVMSSNYDIIISGVTLRGNFQSKLLLCIGKMCAQQELSACIMIRHAN